MGLEIQKGRSRWWYGRVTVNGRKYVRNLGIKIDGRMPDRLRDLGDALFERSRAKAEAVLERWQEELQRKSSAEELIQTVHEIRTGIRIATLPLGEVFTRWKQLPRRRPLSDGYVTEAESVMRRFIAYLNTHYKGVAELGNVQASMARAFMRAEEARGVSEKTYNNALILLRSACNGLSKDAGLPENPFEGIPTKEESTVHRKPFTAEELALIVEKAKADEFIGPIIITGICTAMRRGDCCLLKWESVDLQGLFIAVKTGKTGETVSIPIFPLFEAVLRAAKAHADKAQSKSPYVFPAQAVMYRTNDDGITYRARGVLAQAGFYDSENARDGKPQRGEIRQERKQGLRRASVRDFHSFRVTWVTLALNAGVPIELVQKVTGHRTAQIVQKHYFQPGKEDFRAALAAKLPALMMGGATVRPELTKEKICEKLDLMNAKNWVNVRQELLAGLRPPAPL